MVEEQVQANPEGENVRVSGVSLQPVHWDHLDALAAQADDSRSRALRTVINNNIMARRIVWALKHNQVTQSEAGREILGLFL